MAWQSGLVGSRTGALTQVSDKRQRHQGAGGNVVVLITGPLSFERTCQFTLDTEAHETIERVRATLTRESSSLASEETAHACAIRKRRD